MPAAVDFLIALATHRRFLWLLPIVLCGCGSNGSNLSQEDRQFIAQAVECARAYAHFGEEYQLVGPTPSEVQQQDLRQLFEQAEEQRVALIRTKETASPECVAAILDTLSDLSFYAETVAFDTLPEFLSKCSHRITILECYTD